VYHNKYIIICMYYERNMNEVFGIMISMLYIGEYLYLIQNNLFRIGGLLLVAIVYIFAMNQHKYNMPAYREPLYSKIVEYLQNDDM